MRTTSLPRRWLAVAATCALAGAGACVPYGEAYTGTGAIQISGQQPVLLASHAVTFTPCPRPVPPPDPESSWSAASTAPPESVMTIGAECIVHGTGTGYAFSPRAGEVCTLPFAEGKRTLRVTEVIVRYGISGAGPRARTVINPGQLDMTLGGDDVASGRHALYRFVGVGGDVPDGPAPGLCDKGPPPPAPEQRGGPASAG